MPRSIPLLLAVTTLLVVASAAGPVGALVQPDRVVDADTEFVDGENDGTYHKPATVLFDVETNDTYELRTADDRALVAQLAAENGTVTVDTEGVDPGEYVLLPSDGDDVVYRFTVEVNPTTTTEPANDRADDGANGPSVSLQAGARYERGTVVTVDVDSSESYEVVPVFEWNYAMYPGVDDGTVRVDTSELRLGWYAVRTDDGEEVLGTFEVVASTDEESGPKSPDDNLVVARSERADAVDVESRDVRYRGQVLRFRVDGDTPYVLRSPDGDNLGAFTSSDHAVFVNTTTLSPGVYRLERRNGPTVYRVAIARQRLDAVANGTTVRLASNRRSFRLAVESDALSREDLLAAFPTARASDGRVVLNVSGGEASRSVDETALDPGTYTLTLTAPDTGANATVTVTVLGAGNATATNGTDTARALPQTTTATNAVTASSEGESTTDGASRTETPVGTTSTKGPGFGVLVALTAAVAGATMLLARRRSR
ncbi:hypothetical protein [Halobaculum limi]|uniref:hypothetical protein n=1 Tax=Halobaculum limi TaxID=3031916 RepID=UPI0024062F44|nr:hypothetical protein [Halobaculum sp. YSMS11]